jgi:hypothetical protein
MTAIDQISTIAPGDRAFVSVAALPFRSRVRLRLPLEPALEPTGEQPRDDGDRADSDAA